MDSQRKIMRSTEASLGIPDSTFALIAERRKQEGDICDYFDLHFQGRASPFTLLQEAGIALGLCHAGRKARGREGMVTSLSDDAEVDLWTTVKIMSGLFRMEELGTHGVSKLAEAAGLTLNHLLAMDHLALIEGKRWIRWDFPKGLLIKLLRNDREDNGGRYEDCINGGTRVRLQRTEQGLTRFDLSRLSGVDVSWVDFLEHGNIPCDRLYSNMDKIAKKLGTTTGRLLGQGRAILRDIAEGESYDIMVERAKDLVDRLYLQKYETRQPVPLK